MDHTEIAIAGAGIIGLSTALELAAAGRRVIVFERGTAMRESSWAAAGMLAANDPENPAALKELSRFSIGLYPDFLRRVEQLSGKKVPVRTTQTLQGAHALPPGTREADDTTVRAIAPGLQRNALKFFLIEEQSIDPRDLARALPEAAKAAGVTLHEQTAVTNVVSASGQVRVKTSRGEWTAEHFVNACGAWAGELAEIPIAPRKGQMVLVESSEPLTATLRTPHLYLVPRDDRRIVIGATVENIGYDKIVDPAAIDALRAAAAELWPPIQSAHILDTWAGLRPAASDALPVIGPSDERGCWLALGHFRNGIMLAPGTARLLRQMIRGEAPGVNPEPFSAARFAAAISR